MAATNFAVTGLWLMDGMLNVVSVVGWREDDYDLSAEVKGERAEKRVWPASRLM